MKKVLILLIILSLISTGCKDLIRPDGDGIKVKRLVPAEVNVARYKKIAILDLDGKGGKEIAQWLETSLQNAQVDGNPYFEVISRSQYQKLLAEQRLGMMGAVDPKTAAKIGKISGSQAIVTGSVSSYRFHGSRYNKQVKRYQGKKEYYQTVQCNAGDAYVEFTVHFIDSTTGQIIASTSSEGQYIGDTCHGVYDEMGGGLAGGLLGAVAKSLADSISQMGLQQRTENVKIGSLDAPERMIKGAAMLTIEKFMKKITPRYEAVNVVIKEGDSGGFGISFKSKPEHEKQIDSAYEIGYKYAVRGQWDDAVAQWEKVLSIEKERPAAIYNIGVAFEMLGDLNLAEKQYKMAADIKADDTFLDSLARVRKTMAERVKICEQTGAGCPPKRVQGPLQTAIPPSSEQGVNKQSDTSKGDIKTKGSHKNKRDSIELFDPNSTAKVIIKETVMIADNPNSKNYVGRANVNSEVEKLAEQGNWVKIRVSLGEISTEGWISKCHIKGVKCVTKKPAGEKKPPSKSKESVSPM